MPVDNGTLLGCGQVRVDCPGSSDLVARLEIGGRRRQPVIEWRTIVWSRPGPTPTAEIRAPDSSSSRATYVRALAGSSSNERHFEMSSHQPGSSSYTGTAWCTSVCVIGISYTVSPFTL